MSITPEETVSPGAYADAIEIIKELETHVHDLERDKTAAVELLRRRRERAERAEAEVERQAPRLRRVPAEVVSVGIDPARPYVELRLNNPDGEGYAATFRCDAKVDLVDRVYSMTRGEGSNTIIAQFVTTPGQKRAARLLNAYSTSSPRFAMTMDEAKQRTREAWSDTFDLLQIQDTADQGRQHA